MDGQHIFTKICFLDVRALRDLKSSEIGHFGFPTRGFLARILTPWDSLSGCTLSLFVEIRFWVEQGLPRKEKEMACFTVAYHYARDTVLNVVVSTLDACYDGRLSHPTIGVALFAPKSPWAIEFLM